MGTSIVNLLPEHQRLLANPHMVRDMLYRSIARHGEDAIFAWMGRSDENFGKGLAIGSKLAPKQIEMSGSITVENYVDAIEARGGNQKVIDGDYEVIETKKNEPAGPSLFMWPDCFHVDFTPEPSHA